MAGSEGTGERFQRDTRYYRDREPVEPPHSSPKPALYKRYEGARIVRLDPAASTGGLPLWEAIRARRSVRSYSDQSIVKSELSQMLWATQGITKGSGQAAYRATPSAGALYPVETYVAIHAVDGIEPGVYHYGVGRHQLEELKTGDFRGALEKAALGQQMVRQAAVVFIWSAIFDRCKREYGQRAYRYVYLDARVTSPKTWRWPLSPRALQAVQLLPSTTTS